VKDDLVLLNVKFC